MENNQRLTEEQRELASKNHNLIYWFANKNNISIDDFYDVLAIGLCKAARAFDDDKGEFSTFACKCMKNELYMHLKSARRQCVIPREIVLYGDAPIKENGLFGSETLFDIIPDKDSSKRMSCAIMLKELHNTLGHKEKMVFELMLSGMKHREIADMMNCKRQNVTRYVKNIRMKANAYMESNR